MPQISVIIPTCNRAGFVAAAVKSVLAQSLRDLEIIVVDDASTDDTTAVIENLHDRKIVYTRHEQRRGGAAARNTGILHSTGEYVAFLDDDDEWYPEKLARQMDVMLASPAEVGGVYTGHFIVDRSDGKIRGQLVPIERGDVQQALLTGNCIGPISSMLMRRSCLDRVGLFDERLPSFQDYDLWLRAARQYQFEYIREPLLKYYVQSDKLWTNSDALVRGLELMLGKYGHSQAFRRNCGAYFLKLGVQYCDGRQFSAGRKALLRAARLNRLAVEPYVYLALAMLGGESFTRARRAQATVLSRLRSREVRNFFEIA
jgi:glycosyltransferase involved in cell wall biosynthesis